MRNKIHSMLLGTGMAVPDNILTNHDLEKMVDTSDQWITERTGIKIRRIVNEKQNNSDLASEAAQKALADAGLKAKDLDTIIIATVTGDVTFPSTACYVQDKIGAVNAAAFDIQAACAGFIFGLSIADSYVATGRSKNVIVIGSEILSRIVD